MSLEQKHQHWLDADDNEFYASELRTAAAVYIAELEAALAALTKGITERIFDEVQKCEQAEAALAERDAFIEHCRASGQIPLSVVENYLLARAEEEQTYLPCHVCGAEPFTEHRDICSVVGWRKARASTDYSTNIPNLHIQTKAELDEQVKKRLDEMHARSEEKP